jgi:putative endonuclease
MRKEHNYYVYILTNYKKKTLYVGMTNNLVQRLREHYERRGNPKSFTGKYYCYYLIWFEWHKYVNNAIAREKEIKLLKREKKEELINSYNPDWTFLNIEFCGQWPPQFGLPVEK